MKPARWIALSVLLAAVPAHATAIDLGLGADWWLFDRGYGGRGMFELTLGLRGQLARHIQLGGRFGGLLASPLNYVGAPIDLQLRANVANGRVYLDGLVGPWILFNSSYPLRFHAAFGFGLQASWVTFGFEMGWLDPSALVGIRVAFRI
jgi:hypothetical protein